MNLALLGKIIRNKRAALGLTQEQLADMAALSRQSLSGIEQGQVNVTLDTLTRVLDVLGLAMEVSEVATKPAIEGGGLWRAAPGADARYAGGLPAEELERALASGEVAPRYRTQMAQFLDKAPLALVTRTVAETAARRGCSPRAVWKNLRAIARALHATRGGLWG